MHKNWVWKEYDQCVTCLADDPRNLGTRSSTLRTPGILSQTNNSIHKHSTKCTDKTQIRRSNQKIHLKNSGLQKESNQTEKQNSTTKETRLLILD